MFKIKKNHKKTLTKERDPLAQTNNNQTSVASQKFKGRPQSGRLNRKPTSHQLISRPLDRQLGQTPASQQTFIDTAAETRVIDRQTLEENIRRLSAAIFKDRISLFGEVKEELVRRSTQKAIFKPEMMQQNWQEHLVTLIETEMQKISKAKELEKRCEKRVSKIEDMIEHRLLKLTSLR